MDFDDTFTTGYKLYNQQQKLQFQKKTFKLIKQEKDYYEIMNAHSIITIYKNDNQVAKLGEDKEDGYYFKYNSNDIYYIQFEFPSYTKDWYGFQVSIDDAQLNLLSSSSSLTLTFFNEREFSLTVKNTEKSSQIIAIEIYFDSQYGNIESALAEENSKSFTPLSKKYDIYQSRRSYYYYEIIQDELIFKPTIKYQYSQPYQFNRARISFEYENSIISENLTKCNAKSSSNNFDYYKLEPPNNKPYYEISFKENSELYNVKDNFNKKEITSIQKYTIDTYGFLMVNYANYDACFAIIFSDKNNIITEDSIYNLTLFDSRNYDATFRSSKEYIQIKYKKNQIFNLTLYSPNEGKKIEYKYFNLKTNEYVFIFKKNIYELPIQFQFIKIGTISNYYNFEFSYNGVEEDLIEENIDNDTFKCVSTTTFFNIKYNQEKEYIYLLINDTISSYINNEKISDISSTNNFYQLNENKVLKIFPSDKKICFELKYEKNNGEINIDRIDKKSFTIVSKNTFIINFLDLEIDKEYFIGITSENENIEFNYYILDNYKYNYKELIYFKAKRNIQKFTLSIGLKNNNNYDILNIHFYYYESIKEDKFQCLDRIIYYNISNNIEKPYIYLISNDIENIYLNDQKLSNIEGENNFYDLNSKHSMNIYANENNIICFELIYETKKGIFELDGITIKNYNIFLQSNKLEFDLINLIENMTYYIEIINDDNNIQFENYKLGDEQYDFIKDISFIAKSDKIKFELPVNLKNMYDIGNLMIHFYYIVTIDKDNFECLNTIKYYKINYNMEKEYLYLITNDTSNSFLNNTELKEIKSKNNFYEINKETTLDIYANKKNIICFELKYEIDKNYFLIKEEKNFTFNIFTSNDFIFNFTDLIQDIYYYITINSENSNIYFDTYTLDGERRNWKSLISFKAIKDSILFNLPISLKSYKDQDKLYINFYHETIEEKIDEEGEPTAVKVATILSYICFAIILFPLIILILGCCGNDSVLEGICGAIAIYPWKKIKAVYFCKRD